jgi:hypothetical protein
MSRVKQRYTQQRYTQTREMTPVSVVLETDSVHPFDNLTITDCLAALARQDYPRDLVEVIAVDGGKVPALAALACIIHERVLRVLPAP